MRHRMGVENEKGGGEELRGVEGRETITRAYCMRKESIFNKRENIACYSGLVYNMVPRPQEIY